MTRSFTRQQNRLPDRPILSELFTYSGVICGLTPLSFNYGPKFVCDLEFPEIWLVYRASIIWFPSPYVKGISTEQDSAVNSINATSFMTSFLH